MRDILIVSDTHGRLQRLDDLIEYRQRLLKTFMDLDVPPEIMAEITRPMRDKTDEEKERMAGEAVQRLLSAERE